MRLLSRIAGKYAVTPNHDAPAAPYAILSHCWGPVDEEISFLDLQHASEKAGWHKIKFCLDQAERDGLRYAWIDTCCIDKRNNSELSEAINLMYQYYTDAEVCYVFMDDVDQLEDFVGSRWHTRGWTLQELCAPKELRFYNKNEQLLGDRQTLRDEILQACEIDVSQTLTTISLPERFKWSLRRSTSKVEDASYCMLGLLEVSMVINYGVGAGAAQDELFRAIRREHGEKTIRQIRALLKGSSTNSTTLLSRLEFKDMGFRRETISIPIDGTCEWLLQHPQYKHWQSNSGCLWIKGKPGAGKSTLIRFADSRCDVRKLLRISYYFNARGAQIERTSEGLYRALLWQLLQSNTVILTRVYGFWTTDGACNLQTWSRPVLQRLLMHAVKQLSRPLVCYVDALDECAAAETQEMIDFLTTLAKAAKETFSICFASRYYPSVIIQDSIELRLEAQSEHDQSIAAYVADRLKVECNPEGDALRENVITKANKVFFWVVLVVRTLNQEIANGNRFLLQERLQELPSELSKLMIQLVNHEAGSVKIFQASVQWLLFAARTLTPTQYYLNVLSSLYDGSVLVWNEDEHLCSGCTCSRRTGSQLKLVDRMSLTDLKNFVSSSSKGFAEVTTVPNVSQGYAARYGCISTKDYLSEWEEDDGESYRVQFIHATVRDFFLSHGAFQQLCPEVTVNLESWSHDIIRRLCQRYLLANESCLGCRHPLFDYARALVIYHAERAAMHIPQDDFVVFYSRWAENINKSIAMRPRSPVHDLNDYVQNDAGRLVRTAHRLGYDLNAFSGHSRPIFQAITRASVFVLQTLLDSGASVDVRDRNGRTPLLTLLAGDSMYDTGLSMVKLLVDRGADVRATDPYGNTALLLACQGYPNPEIIEILLNAGADVQHRNDEGETACARLNAQFSAWSTARIVQNWDETSRALYRGPGTKWKFGRGADFEDEQLFQRAIGILMNHTQTGSSGRLQA